MSEPVIQSLVARRIWDSRGRPTVEAEVRLSDGAVGRGIAPAGASRGSREAIEKRDGGKRFGGFDVQDALQGIRDEIAPALVGLDPFDQAALAMVRRSDPVPPPPPLVADEGLSFTLPVIFRVKGKG